VFERRLELAEMDNEAVDETDEADEETVDEAVDAAEEAEAS
jgi:hypothetical protein